MCYEYWRSQRMRAQEELAKQRAKELLQKVRSSKPEPVHEEPVMAEEEKELVEA